MNWYRNLNFRQKLVLPSLLLIVVILVSATVSVLNINNLADDARLLADQMLPDQDYVLQADKDIVQVQTAERSIIHLEPGSELFTEQARLQEINLGQAFDRINSVRSDNPQLLRLKRDFLQKFENWQTATRSVTELMRQGEKQRAEEASFSEVNGQFWALRDVLDEIIEIINQEKDSAVSMVKTGVQQTYSVVLTSTLISLAVCAFFVFGLPAMITRSISLLASGVDDITKRDGDLTKRIDVISQDELGTLAAKFNAFLDNLHNIISQVASSTQQFSQATGELEQLSITAKSGLAEQKQATQSVATATSQMASSIDAMASQALSVAEEAKQANENASLGQNVIHQTITTFNELSGEITRAEDSINRLAEDSKNIGSVLDVIESIAEQTNLLALNAAIEAARAGEQGRGFAVVADEVRSLAAKTQQSTEEIKTMIDNLRKGSGEAVQAITQSNSKMLESVDVVKSAEEALSNISTSITQISAANIQIADAASQQRASTSEINSNVSSIAEESNNSLNNAETVARSSQTLATLSQGLSNLVGSFRV